MEWEARIGDDRSVDTSRRRRISEPRVKEPVTYGHARSFRDDYNGSCFRKLSQFSENLQRMDSTSKKFQWEFLLAKNPVNANSKSGLGLKHADGSDNVNRELEFFDSHLVPKPLSIDNLEANNLLKSHSISGATRDGNLNDGNATGSYGINGSSSYLSSSRKFDGTAYESNGIFVRNHPMIESARVSYEEKRKETSPLQTQTSYSPANARITEFEGISRDKPREEMLTEPVETELVMDELLDYRNRIEQFNHCNRYIEVQPSKFINIAAALKSPLCRQMGSNSQDDCYHDFTRLSAIMEPISDGYESSVGGMAETRARSHYVYEYSSVMEQDGEVLSPETGAPLKNEKETDHGFEKLQMPEAGSNGLSVTETYQGSSEMKVDRKQRRGVTNSGLRYSEKATPKRKRSRNSRLSVHYPTSNPFRNRINHFSYEYEPNLCRRNEQWDDCKLRRHPSESLMKRLGPCLRDSSSDPFVRERKKTKWLRNTNHGFQSDDCFEEKTKHSTSKPPEANEELSHQTKSAFFKFVKILNENPSQRKKSKGGAGALKCIVCGSKSKEYLDTRSLSSHTYDSPQGPRGEHLGLHKALCFLMGWCSEATPTHKWVQRPLPYAEFTALKEDLIIWPPVLIIHNSSIADSNTSKPVTISCEELEVVIRGMGFGEKMKVVHDQPENQSIMVVTFVAMFSGLQEAERLHKHYADNNRGRVEFHKLKFSNLRDSKRDLHANEMESVLYGYLGLAGDLDKLNFQTKKRSVVRSKKEIRAIVDASAL